MKEERPQRRSTDALSQHQNYKVETGIVSHCCNISAFHVMLLIDGMVGHQSSYYASRGSVRFPRLPERSNTGHTRMFGCSGLEPRAATAHAYKEEESKADDLRCSERLSDAFHRRAPRQAEGGPRPNVLAGKPWNLESSIASKALDELREGERSASQGALVAAVSSIKAKTSSPSALSYIPAIHDGSEGLADAIAGSNIKATTRVAPNPRRTHQPLSALDETLVVQDIDPRSEHLSRWA